MLDEKEGLRAIILQVIGNTEFKLIDFDVKFGQSKKIVRVFLDSLNGITIDQCRVFSRQIEAEVDAQGFLGEAYALEVSSPGIERPLKEAWQFKKNIGRNLKIHYQADGISKEAVGKLMEVENDEIRLAVSVKKKTTEDLRIPVNKITTAKIQLQW